MKTGDEIQEEPSSEPSSEPEEKQIPVLTSQPAASSSTTNATSRVAAGVLKDTANLPSTAAGLGGSALKIDLSAGETLVGALLAASDVSSHNKRQRDNVGFDAPTKLCLHRIMGDLNNVQREPLDGILVVPDEDRNNICHALIIGPPDTPYELGMLRFLLEFPNEYPFEPPRVTLLTTDGGRVRFNPNLYSCGKVCLSILGTWSGPGWSSAQNIGSLLLSIRSVLQEYPFRNEPGFEDTPTSSQQVVDYNRYLRHETLKVAVIGFIEEAMVLRRYNSSQEVQQGPPGQDLPTSLLEFAREHFLEHVESYKYMCDEYNFLDGRQHYDIFSSQRCTFQFRYLKQRIEQVENLVQPLAVSAAMPNDIKNESEDNRCLLLSQPKLP